MILVGITGTIGSGKSTLSRMVRNRGFDVIDIDAIGKEVSTGKEVVDEVRGAFGDEYVTGGRINVEKMKEVTFRNRDTVRKMENIVHPRARAELERRIETLKKSGARAVFIDGPLLFETGLYKRLDRIVVVSTEIEKIKERLRLRGMTENDMARRISLQIPLEEKEMMADHVVYNNGKEGNLREELDTLLKKVEEWEEIVDAP